MKLQSLLTGEFTPNLSKAFIISKRSDHKYQAQQVDYHPEILNLGVVLLGYYYKIKKVQQLLSLGNLLSIGHYLQSPTVLKYGKNFKSNPDFLKLSNKSKKHLTDELQDGTIAFSRDLHHSTPLIYGINLIQLINKLPPQAYYYYFSHHRWLLIDNHNNILPLNQAIKNQLGKEK